MSTEKPLPSGDVSEPNSGPKPKPKPKPNFALPWLTRIAQGSTPFIGVFLAIHLAPPVFANLGGSSLASQVMLLGREYYQTPFGEISLVLAPVAIHFLSSIAKRFVSTHRIRPWTSVLTVTGYATYLIFAPVHFITHRLNPQYSDAPVYAVGPAELDYEFVKVGLETWPWRSWILYAGLVGCVALHAMEGTGIVYNTFFKGSFKVGQIKWSPKVRRIAALAVSIPVLSGVWVMSSEGLMIFSSLASRYHAAFTRSYLFRL